MKKENILVFCAHSDDQIFGPGATLAKYSKKGHNIYSIVFSYGESGLSWLKTDIAIKKRVDESRKADKMIGGSGVAFLGLKEGKFMKDSEKTIEKLKNIIISKKPSKIFTHHHDDPHPDHRAVNKLVIKTLDDIDYNGDVFAFDIWNPFNIRKTNIPRLYEDVTDTFKIKAEALKLFKSQKMALLTLLWSIYVRALVHGFHIHKLYAERFFKLR